MANPQHVNLIRQGADVWNAWMNKNHQSRNSVRPDLSTADLSGMPLRQARLAYGNLSELHAPYVKLAHASLAGARLQKADLSWANLGDADLGGADLSGANLFGTYFGGANLSRPRLTGATMLECNLGGANLTGADLRFVNLRGATIMDTVFGDTDLRDAEIAECIHKGPSTIDYRTFARSPNLPLAFLRGCGLSDDLIGYLPSLHTQAIQFYSCFISYSTKDQEFTNRLHADLQNKGVRCWFAPHDVQGGRKLHEQIDEAIRVYDRLLLVLSPASMDSEWVKTEIAKARRREQDEKRRMLFPVRLVEFEALRNWECFDADTGKDSAIEIREYYVPDFSNWKDHDAYQKEFEKLLRDLKATQGLRLAT